MSELPPEQTDMTTPGESAPASYEAALSAAAKMRELGVEDAFDSDNPEIIALLDTIDAWETLCGLEMAGVESAEKANNIVLAALLFINAGFRDIKYYREALERLSTEFSSVPQEEGTEEIREILGSAIDEIEAAIESVNPNEKFERAIGVRVTEALQKAKSGDPTETADAWRLLTSTLMHPEYKRYFSKFPGKKQLLIDMRNAVAELRKGDGTALARIEGFASQLL